jgi:hypothetical protein
MYVINWKKGREAIITEALRRRKGVCENYAAIFNDIAVRAGLTSFIVEGYTKQSGRIDRAGHTWCAVNLDGEWFLCDPTWDKDAGTNPNYFLAHPTSFIVSHIPFDPMWQLVNNPVSHDDFYYGITRSKKNKVFFNFRDSIKAFSQLSELKKLEATVARMNHPGHLNELLRNQIAYTNMLIAIAYEEQDMNLYNSAVADLNKAAAVFNNFVQYRNNRFNPAKTDAEINALLEPATAFIYSALQKTDGIGKVIINHQYDPAILRNRINSLGQRVFKCYKK